MPVKSNAFEAVLFDAIPQFGEDIVALAPRPRRPAARRRLVRRVLALDTKVWATAVRRVGLFTALR